MTGRPNRKVVTRADVARLAGVSTAVVSYVVNDGPRPVAPTRPAASVTRSNSSDTGRTHRPSAQARHDRHPRTRRSRSSNPFYAELGHGNRTSRQRQGAALLIASSNSDLDLESRLIGDLAGRQLDGLLVSGAAGPPVPGSGRSPARVHADGVSGQPSSRARIHHHHSNAQQGATLLTHHLQRVHGHRSVALVMGTHSLPWRDGRELGWQLAVRNRTAPIVRVPFTRQGGYEAVSALLSAAPTGREPFWPAQTFRQWACSGPHTSSASGCRTTSRRRLRRHRGSGVRLAASDLRAAADPRHRGGSRAGDNRPSRAASTASSTSTS